MTQTLVIIQEFLGLIIGKLEATFTLALFPPHLNIVDKIYAFIL